MADRYWVGGTGNWNASTTTNWSATSGGAGGASVPTSADNVIFNASSDAGSGYTVTITAGVCNDLTMSGLDVATIVSMGVSDSLNIYGSMTLPATNLTWSATNTTDLIFAATTTGKTITTNGVALVSRLILNGVGGAWTLGSALTISNILYPSAGTFSTNNYNVSCSVFQRTATTTAVINLGSTTLTATGNGVFLEPTGLTLNAGTSQITCSAANLTFAGGGLTYYNVSFTSVANGTVTITGANTFNNLTFTSRSATGIRVVSLGANQTVSGALTLGAANTSIRRMFVVSDTVGTQRTITCNGTLAAIADVDFRDINAAGTVATPWTGTRIGNCLGNSNITFTTAANKYWNLAAGGNWSDTGWATSSGGAVAANNFPLAQDKAIIENTGLNTSATITINLNWQIGELDTSTRTNAMTLASGTANPAFYKNITLSSAVTMTGTGAWFAVGQGTTQILDVNTATFTPPITIESPSGTFQLAENTTCSATVTLTQGTLNLNNFNLTTGLFSSNNSNTRVIAFGTGEINCSGNNGTLWATNTVTNLTQTGTPVCNFTYSGSTGTRQISSGALSTNSLSLNVTAGTDIINIANNSTLNNLNFTGFSGSITNVSSNITLRGNLTLSSTMTFSRDGFLIFAATSGTKTITSNGKTLDISVTFNGIGGTFEIADALTLGSTRALTLNAGTVKFKNGTTNSAGTFVIVGTITDQVVIQSTSPGSNYTLSVGSGSVNAFYATITDCIASLNIGNQLNAFRGAGNIYSYGNINGGNNRGIYFTPPGTDLIPFF